MSSLRAAIKSGDNAQQNERTYEACAAKQKTCHLLHALLAKGRRSRFAAERMTKAGDLPRNAQA
jgi:hypothetical protein